MEEAFKILEGGAVLDRNNSILEATQLKNFNTLVEGY